MPARSTDLPFGEFLDYLRHQGFEIGVEHQLRLQVLLDRVGDSLAPDDLKSHLAPLFATRADQQAQFYRAFDTFYPLFGAEPDRAESSREPEAAGLSGSAAPHRPRKLGWMTSAQAVLAVAAVSVIVIYSLGRWERRAPGRSAAGPAVGADSVAGISVPSVQDSVAAAPGTATGPAVPGEAPREGPGRIPAVPELPPESLLLVPMFVLLLYETHRLRERRVALVRDRRSVPPSTWPLALEARGETLFRSEDYRAAARDMRHRQEADVHRLDVDASVRATVDAAGYPTLRFSADTRPPEYLFLVERDGPRDHLASLHMELGRTLVGEGVHVDRFFYDGDLRVCSRESGDRHVLLSELRQRIPNHRLLVIGTGDRLLDPVTGGLEPWTRELVTWRERALLTPRPVTAWGIREVVLAGHFIVLPAGSAGLVTAVDHFAAGERSHPSSWKQQRSDGSASPPSDPCDMAALRAYLGPHAFQWLCACALYPELQWDLTLFLGSLPALGRPMLTSETVLRLARLDWFRQGSIPEEARAALTHELEPTVERAAREGIIDLLERSPAPAGTIAADRRQLGLIVQRMFLHRRGTGERRRAERELRHIPDRHIEQDYALLRLLERPSRAPLALLLPGRLRRIFFRRGLPGFGLRAGFRLTVGISAILLLGLLTSRWRVSQITKQATDMARQIPAVVAPVPDLQTLTRLEELRGATEGLSGFSRGGPVTRFLGRLNGGSAAFSNLKAMYFDRFRSLLWNGTANALVDSLAALPAEPASADAYGPAYDALKAYILMASHPTRGDTAAATFLPPVLERFWAAGLAIDTARIRLAAAQFGFYSRELVHGNPYPDFVPDDGTIQRTQSYLCAFAGSDRIYDMVRKLAAAASTPVRWSDPDLPNPVVVPAEFTRTGWVRAQASFDDARTLAARDSWVLGTCAMAPAPPAELASSLRARYTADYVEHWTRFLQGGSVGRYTNLEGAVRKLAAMSTSESPVLRMLGVVADNTSMDTMEIGRAFAPVHRLVPPVGSRPDAAAPYLQALADLGTAVARVATTQAGARTQARQEAAAKLQTVSARVASLTIGSRTVGAARTVHSAVATLLRSPLVGLDQLMAPLPYRVSVDSVRSLIAVAEVRSERREYPEAFQSLTEATERLSDLRSTFPAEQALSALAREIDLAVTSARTACEAWREIQLQRGLQAPICRQPARAGVLELVVAPWATVTIDGVRRGDAVTRQEFELAPGVHVLILENPAFTTVEENFVIRSGDTLRFATTMKSR